MNRNKQTRIAAPIMATIVAAITIYFIFNNNDQAEAAKIGAGGQIVLVYIMCYRFIQVVAKIAVVLGLLLPPAGDFLDS